MRYQVEPGMTTEFEPGMTTEFEPGMTERSGQERQFCREIAGGCRAAKVHWTVC